MKGRRGKRPSHATANSARIRRVPPESDSNNSDYTGAEEAAQWKFKIVLLGNSGVGKTWLVERLLGARQHQASPSSPRHGCDGSGDSSAEAGTVGLSVNLSKARLTDGRTVLLQLWDTSGQDKYRNLVRNYIPGANCILILYEPSAGLQAARQTLARWHEFAKAAAAPTAALVAIVALSRQKAGGGGSGGADRGSSDEAAAAGVNFGRVFASSLCGCFFHHQCGSRRETQLTARWLADQLVKRQQARTDATVRLLLQQQVTLAASENSTASSSSGAGQAATEAAVGCFWCQKLLCCRATAIRCGGGGDGCDSVKQ